jgi:hypothetical protein
MTCRRTLVAALSALLVTAIATADDPSPIFRFKEYKHPLPGGWGGTVLSADGKLMAAAASETVVVWEAWTGKEVTRFKYPRAQTVITLGFTADGKELAADGSHDTATRFWDIKTGKPKREVKLPEGWREFRGGRLPPVLAFNPGATRLITFGGSPWRLRVHDATTGEGGPELEGTAKPRRVTYSPDGRLIAYAADTGSGLSLFDATTGKKLRQLIPNDLPGGRWSSFATFSPDAKYLADGEPGGKGSGQLDYLTVWRVSDGKRCARVFTPRGFTSAAFAGDGRTLLAAGSPHGLYLYDLATETLWLSSKLSPHASYSVTASADGTTLAIINSSAPPGGQTVYVMPPPKYDDNSFGPTGPTEKQLAESWDGLVGDNEFRKAHEVARLRPHADRVVALAREKVKPVPDLYRQRAEDLIANLDSPDIRDKVTENLHLMAHDFEPLLESAVEKAQGETRSRLTAVLKKMKETPPPEKLTTAVRAVEVLGQLGTPTARKALEELAAGAVGARITAEAAAALERNADRLRGQN